MIDEKLRFDNIINKYSRIPSIYSEIFSVVILLALFIFLTPNINSLWFDELFTAYWIQHSQSFLWTQGRLEETNPPLYFSFLSGFSSIFGQSEFVLRLPSVIAALLAASVAVVLGRLIGGAGAGFLAGLAFVLLPVVNLFAQEARPVAFLPFLQGAALLGCALELRRAYRVGSQDGGSRCRGLGSAALLLGSLWLAIHTHPAPALFTAAVFMILGTAALMRRQLGLPFLLRWGLMSVLLFLLSLEQASMMLMHSQAGAHAPRDAFSWTDIPRTVLELTLGEGAHGWPLALKLLLVLPMFGAALVGIMRLSEPDQWALVGIPVLFFGLVSAISFVQPLLMARYMIGMVVPFGVLIGLGLWHLRSRPFLFWVCGCALGALMLVLCLRQADRGTLGEWHPTQDWRAVTALIASEPACQAPIYSDHVPGLAAWPHYDPDNRIRQRSLVEDGEEPTRFLARETGYARISKETFTRALLSGEKAVVILVGRQAGLPRLRAMLTQPVDLTWREYRFQPSIVVFCKG